MNRRAFLRPRHLVSAATGALGALDAFRSTSCERAVGEMALIRVARLAMATQFEVVLPLGTNNALACAEAALDEIDRIEEQLSAYRASSEVSRINRLAPASSIAIGEDLFQLLELSRRLNRLTEGAFDITAGPLIKAWGFFRRSHRIPDADELADARLRVGMDFVDLNVESRRIRFHAPGVELNLGSIGKGYALDRCRDLLTSEYGVRSALMHGGRSSVYALGSPPGVSDGWKVALCHPCDAERRMATIRLKNRGLATSASTYQHFDMEGKRFGHIIDPRTGWPAEGACSGTVLAPTAAEADALATAFYIQGVDWTRRYCEEHPDIGAVLLPDEHAAPVVINVANDEIEVTSPGAECRD